MSKQIKKEAGPENDGTPLPDGALEDVKFAGRGYVAPRVAVRCDGAYVVVDADDRDKAELWANLVVPVDTLRAWLAECERQKRAGG